MSAPFRIMCVAGEASGDLHGGALVRRLRQIYPDAHIYGMGMRRMAEAGMELTLDAGGVAVVGLTEVLRYLPRVKRNYDKLKREIIERPPDLLIVIDNPEISLRLARVAKTRGIKVLYYISPQIWAWRPWRIKKIRASVDAMAVILPFEEALYRDAGVPSRYVGHPLVHDAPKSVLRDFKSDGEDTVLLLPGSRESEIKRILPSLTRAAKQMAERSAKPLKFTLLVAPSVDRSTIEAEVEAADLRCEFRDQAYPAMREATLALTASGTVTLQLALSGTPMVVVYRLSALSYALARLLIKIPHISLVNILGGREIVPELLQGQATPERICTTALEILGDRQRLQGMHEGLREVAALLGDEDGAANTARMASELLEKKT